MMTTRYLLIKTADGDLIEVRQSDYNSVVTCVSTGCKYSVTKLTIVKSAPTLNALRRKASEREYEERPDYEYE